MNNRVFFTLPSHDDYEYMVMMMKTKSFQARLPPTPQYLLLAAVPHNDYDDCELDDDDHEDDEYGDDDHGGDDENKEFLPPTPQYLPIAAVPHTVYNLLTSPAII